LAAAAAIACAAAAAAAADAGVRREITVITATAPLKFFGIFGIFEMFLIVRLLF